MLHDVTGEGGLGFCYEALPDLLPWGYHGPLIVALDSNILIDLQQHGNAILNEEDPAVDADYGTELDGLAEVLSVWMLRDVRFVVTPRALTDAKRNSERLMERQRPAIDAIAQSLSFQLGDWATKAPSMAPPSPHLGTESGLPDGADRDLVLQAQAIHAHVFLTRDKRVVRQVRLTGPRMAVTSPRALGDALGAAGVEPFEGGVCSQDACPYRGWSLPAPDIGKWGPLFELFG